LHPAGVFGLIREEMDDEVDELFLQLLHGSESVNDSAVSPHDGGRTSLNKDIPPAGNTKQDYLFVPKSKVNISRERLHLLDFLLVFCFFSEKN
jgi:hypothetical protein